MSDRPETRELAAEHARGRALQRCPVTGSSRRRRCHRRAPRVRAPRGDPRTALRRARTEVLIVRGTALDAETLALLPELRAIARTGAGYDNLDVQAATRRGVPIVYAPGVGSQPVAEGTVALMLAAAKRLRELGCRGRDGR